MKVYLIGPMSGIPKFNYPAFITAAEYLREQGFEVQSPTELDDAGTLEEVLASPDGKIDKPVNGQSYEYFLAKSLARILAWKPDMLVALPGWEASGGATKEALVAKALGIPTYRLEDYDPIIGFPLDDPTYDPRCPGFPDHADMSCDERRSFTSSTPVLYEADGPFINPLRQRAITGAVKDNKGKPRTELLPPEPLLGVARVLGFGAEKYKPNNWRLGLSWGQTIGSALRHIFAFMGGEDMDPESGEMHIDNAICQLMFLSTYWHTKTGEDDRWSSLNQEGREASKA